jgi:hypothetical protein
MRISDCGFPSPSEGRIADCLGQGFWEKEIRPGAPGQSAIRNPQSAIRNPQ